MFTTGETVGLAEWIIDDTCLISLGSRWNFQFGWQAGQTGGLFSMQEKSIKYNSIRSVT